MRGAIDCGEFYIHGDKYFAGKPIINCYQLSQVLDFSGCALTETTGTLLVEKIEQWNTAYQDEHLKVYSIFKDTLVPYLAPLKDSTYQRLLLVNWLGSGVKGHPPDFRQYINTSFHEHNKEVNSSVVRKMENTERILRWFKDKKWVFDNNCLKTNKS